MQIIFMTLKRKEYHYVYDERRNKIIVRTE